MQTVLEFLSAGASRAEILRQYPSLDPEDIDACLAVASRAARKNRNAMRKLAN